MPKKMKRPNIFYSALLPVKIFVEEKVIRSKRNQLIILILLLLVIYISMRHREIFFITLLTIAGAMSMVYIRYVPELYVLGVELCMLSTVTCAKAYGPGIGAGVGLVTITAATIMSGRFKPSSFISIFALPLIGFAAGLIDLKIQVLGVVMTVAYDLIVLPLYYLFGSRLHSTLIFFVSHVLFNYWAFTTVAPVLIRMM
jgi:hypothetical protein